ncbi:MAG: hypothetical protein ACOCRZ_03120 [Halothermotrichaceae bacterium]
MDEQLNNNIEIEADSNGTPIWLWFYTYIRIPLGVIFGIVSIINYIVSDISIHLNIPFVIILMSVHLVVFFGIHKRKLWGWYSNWGLLAVEILYYSYSGFSSLLNFFVRLLVLIILWGVPNYFYFSKRKFVFEQN